MVTANAASHFDIKDYQFESKKELEQFFDSLRHQAKQFKEPERHEEKENSPQSQDQEGGECTRTIRPR